MRSAANKRANSALCRWGSRKVLLAALTLVLSAWASRESRELGAQCSVEAKVSIERIGPKGTFAGGRIPVRRVWLTNGA
jgi:hypothetical protein